MSDIEVTLSAGQYVYCGIHHTNERRIKNAPVCGECCHQFHSYRDLLDQDIQVRRDMGQTEGFPTTVEEVFSCPLCTHDL